MSIPPQERLLIDMVPKLPDILPFPVAITPRQTPSPDDPVGANAFYEALGLALAACGRLEGHFTASLVMVLQIAFFKHITPLETVLPPSGKTARGYGKTPSVSFRNCNHTKPGL